MACAPRASRFQSLRLLARSALRSLLPSHSFRSSNAQVFFAEFAHQTNRGYTEADAIATEITLRTSTILRDAQASVSPDEAAPAVTSKPIILKLYSPSVIDLTLIDLPGLIRVPTQDQPPDIDEQVKRMVMTYIRSNNCVILAVSAANVDLANSDSLRIAREVDPTGQRTIGVLTKSDLVDESVQLLQILEGRVYPLRRGYVPVKCRSQKDCQQGITLEDSLRQERKFFATHPLLNTIANQCGVGHLARKLNQILTHHIRLHLPAMKSTIDTLLTEVERDLRRLGTPLDPKTSAAGGLLLQVFTRYARIVDDLLDGRAGPALNKYNESNDHEVDAMPAACELVGGARLHYVFQDWFAPAIMRSDPLARLNDREIKMAIRNASGSSTSLFVPETAFEMLVKKQIHLLEQPAVQCVHQAVQEMLTITEFPIYQMNEFKRFPNLESRVREISKGVILDHLSTTLKSVTDFIRIELAFINKSHPDFVGGNRAIANYLVNAARNCGDSNTVIAGETGGSNGKSSSYPTGIPTPNTKDGSGSNDSTEPPPLAPKVPGAATPTTGNSDSDDNNVSNAPNQRDEETLVSILPLLSSFHYLRSPNNMAFFFFQKVSQGSSEGGVIQSQQQSFLSFWRRHPLQQTTAPPQLTNRPSAPSSRTVSNRRQSGSPKEGLASAYSSARIPHSVSIPHNASVPTPAQMSHRGLPSPAFMLPLGPTDFLPVDQSERESMELELVKGLISSYFEIVK